MKKTLALILSAILCVGLLAACGTPAADPTPTPLTGAELAEHYKTAIEAGRTESDNTDRPINITGEEEEMGSLFWEMLGFASTDLDAFAVSLSLFNTQAYCVGLFKPLEGKTETVTAGLQKYIESMQSSFEFYLPDQGEIANNAILKTLDDGTVIIVMSDGWQEVYDGIVAAL